MQGRHKKLFLGSLRASRAIKNFQTFLEVKIDINGVNLTPCQAHWVLLKVLLRGAKDKHFFCFLSSCQSGLMQHDFIQLSDRFYTKVHSPPSGRLKISSFVEVEASGNVRFRALPSKIQRKVKKQIESKPTQKILQILGTYTFEVQASSFTYFINNKAQLV